MSSHADRGFPDHQIFEGRCVYDGLWRAELWQFANPIIGKWGRGPYHHIEETPQDVLHCECSRSWGWHFDYLALWGPTSLENHKRFVKGVPTVEMDKAAEGYREYLEAKTPPAKDHSPHYRMAIEPLKFIMENEIPFVEGNVIKYISRWREKGGIQDLDKIIDYVQKLRFDAQNHPERYGL